jgi:hypothetical protein
MNMAFIQEISQDEFDKGYKIKGSLIGSFAEAQEYLGWVLDSKKTDNTQNFKEALRTFSERFGMEGLTTKYLRSLMCQDRKNKNIRIRYLLDKSGFSTIPIKRYYRDLRCLVSNSKRFVFGLTQDGNTTITDEKVETISRLANVFVSEVLHKVITKEEEIKNQMRQNDLKLRVRLLSDTENNKNKGYFEGLPCEDNGNWLAQQKSINRLNWKNSGFIYTNCKECKKEIKFPLCPNIEVDKDEQLAFSIYSALIKDIENEIHFCYDCQRKIEDEYKNWRIEKIKNFLLEMLKNAKEGKSFFGFSPIDFCDEFRIDKKEVGIRYIVRKINELLQDEGILNKIEACKNKGDIVLQINKKI